MQKEYISADELLRDSFSLGLQILESGYQPSYIIGVWRGGTPVGIAVQEVLDLYEIENDHISIRTSSYTGIAEQSDVIRVHGLEYIVDTIQAEDRLLIIDDVFDSGRSIDAIIKKMSKLCRQNMPNEIRVATVYFKPSMNKTERTPDYYLHETESWLVFPHELKGLSREEILANKPIDETALPNRS